MTFKSSYEHVHKLITELPAPDNTFLSNRKIFYPECPFWAELEYFLLKIHKYGNTKEIIRKLSLEAPLNMNVEKAWGLWQQFRSAQFEVSAIFFIEKYFKGKIIEIIPEGKKKSSDFKVLLNQEELLIEAKAQSGQQDGDKHPRCRGSILFDPKEENDLYSWLFNEKNISSRNNKLMVPMAIEAENKEAKILICQTDYTSTSRNKDFPCQIKTLFPQSKFSGEITLSSGSTQNSINVSFFKNSFPNSMNKLKKMTEIWLCNLCAKNYKLVILSQKNEILKNHLKTIDSNLFS